jgi:hypothetical protein
VVGSLRRLSVSVHHTILYAHCNIQNTMVHCRFSHDRLFNKKSKPNSSSTSRCSMKDVSVEGNGKSECATWEAV